MLLFASALLNSDQVAVPDACVWVQHDHIRFAGSRKNLPSEAAQDTQRLDLGDVLLMPGLINAHSHLELTVLEGLPYGGNFVGWIRDILTARQELDLQNQDLAMHEGILRCLRGGTTSVGDHLSVTTNLEILLQSPLRGKGFLEVLGVVPQVAEDLRDVAYALRDQWNSRNDDRWEIIPSPHSVHAVFPPVLAQLLQQSASVFSVHLAESEAERLYFAEAKGPLHDFIAERGSALNRTKHSSVAELESLGLLNSRILAVHGNYLRPEEICLLAEREISVVHCPFSHRYFRHHPFPMEDCRRAGLNVALGTDSLASAGTLSMLEVLREMERQYPLLSRNEILAMATRNGARALKLETQVGSLESGKKADLIGVPLQKGEDPFTALFGAESVCFAMINGEILTGF